MNNTKKYYVYEWFIKETKEIFYVGKGCDNRVTSMKDRNNYFKNIRSKYECDYRILKYFDKEQEAFDFELKRGTELKNIGQAKASFVLGGKQKFISKETRKKISDTLKQNKNSSWNKGKINCYSEETLNKMRNAKLGYKQTEETKQKRLKHLIGHFVSDETRKKHSLSKLGSKNPMYNKKQSKETIEKRVKKLIGHDVSKETRSKIGIANGKKVAQIDIKTNEIIKIFNSCSEAGRLTNSCSSKISMVCNDKRKTCNNYKWKYIS